MRIFRPLARWAQLTDVFARQIDPSSLSKSKPLHVAVKHICGEPISNFHGANIARIGKHILKAQVAIRMMIAQAPPSSARLALLAEKRLTRFDHPLF